MKGYLAKFVMVLLFISTEWTFVEARDLKVVCPIGFAPVITDFKSYEIFPERASSDEFWICHISSDQESGFLCLTNLSIQFTIGADIMLRRPVATVSSDRECNFITIEQLKQQMWDITMTLDDTGEGLPYRLCIILGADEQTLGERRQIPLGLKGTKVAFKTVGFPKGHYKICRYFDVVHFDQARDPEWLNKMEWADFDIKPEDVLAKKISIRVHGVGNMH